MPSYENGLVNLLVCKIYVLQSMKVKKCSEISHLLGKHCQN